MTHLGSNRLASCLQQLDCGCNHPPSLTQFLESETRPSIKELLLYVGAGVEGLASAPSGAAEFTGALHLLKEQLTLYDSWRASEAVGMLEKAAALNQESTQSVSVQMPFHCRRVVEPHCQGPLL